MIGWERRRGEGKKRGREGCSSMIYAPVSSEALTAFTSLRKRYPGEHAGRAAALQPVHTKHCCQHGTHAHTHMHSTPCMHARIQICDTFLSVITELCQLPPSTHRITLCRFQIEVFFLILFYLFMVEFPVSR